MLKKILGIAMISILSLPALADEPRKPPMKRGDSFQQNKEKRLARMEQRKQRLQKNQDCLKNADTPAAAQGCREGGSHAGHRQRL